MGRGGPEATGRLREGGRLPGAARAGALAVGAWLVLGPLPGPGRPASIGLRAGYAALIVATAWWATGDRAVNRWWRADRPSPETRAVLTAAAAFLPAWLGFRVIGADHAAADALLGAFVAGLVHLDAAWAHRHAVAAGGAGRTNPG